MGVVRKTITLTDQQDRWVKAQISAGHYSQRQRIHPRPDPA